MGKHSNKKKQIVRPAGIPASFQPIVDEAGQIKGYADPANPPQEIDSTPSIDGFNLTNGQLGRVHRLVSRHKLKDRVKFLETIIKVHIPLTQALKITGQAFQDGVKEGMRQIIESEKEAKVNSVAKEAQPEVTQESLAHQVTEVVSEAQCSQSHQ